MGADLFSEEPFLNQEPTQQQAQDLSQNQTQPGDDETVDSSQRERYQYWQSKHDKLKLEYDKMLQSQQHTYQAAQQPEQTPQPPSKPNKPVKPANYSPEEAYTDPTSESFKYRSALDDYNEKYQDYLDYYNEQMQQREMAYKQEEEKQRLLDNTKREVMYEYNLSEDEASDFIVKMSDPSMMSLKNLVNYYRFLKGESQPTQPQQQFQQQNRQPLQAVRTNPPPPPAGVIPATGQPSNVTEEDGFVQAMLNYRR